MGISNRDYMRSGRSQFAQAMQNVVPVLIAINVAVFLLWNLASGGMTLFLRDHFIGGWDSLAHGRIWTLLTSVFSHYDFWHLALNMYCLFVFGRSLETRWGGQRFLIFYLVAGVFSSLVGDSITGLLLEGGGSLGASGAVSAVILCYALLNPQARLLFMFVIPVPAIAFVVLFVGFDLFGLLQNIVGAEALYGRQRIGHGAHLAGSLFGFLYLKYFSHGYAGFNLPSMGKRRRRRRRSGEKARIDVLPGVQNPYHSRDPDEERMDQLLVKINRGGLDSLTPEERDFMMEMSQRMRRDS